MCLYIYILLNVLSFLFINNSINVIRLITVYISKCNQSYLFIKSKYITIEPVPSAQFKHNTRNIKKIKTERHKHYNYY